jgi:NADH:ubiquinone oxidoreductase subunit 3 (subunit A)
MAVGIPTKDLLPLVGASVALLAMTSVRSGDLATKLRNNVKEILEKTTKTEFDSARIANLRWQNRVFKFRYILVTICLVVLALSIICFSIPATPDDVVLHLLGIKNVFTIDKGVILLLAGMVIICLEFILGVFTLFFDANSVKTKASNSSVSSNLANS